MARMSFTKPQLLALIALICFVFAQVMSVNMVRLDTIRREWQIWGISAWEWWWIDAVVFWLLWLWWYLTE